MEGDTTKYSSDKIFLTNYQLYIANDCWLALLLNYYSVCLTLNKNLILWRSTFLNMLLIMAAKNSVVL